MKKLDNHFPLTKIEHLRCSNYGDDLLYSKRYLNFVEVELLYKVDIQPGEILVEDLHLIIKNKPNKFYHSGFGINISAGLVFIRKA